MKYLLLLTSIFFSCAHQKELDVNLKPVNNKDNFMGISIHFTSIVEPNFEQEHLAERLNLNNFIITEFNYRLPTTNINGVNEKPMKTIFLVGARRDSIILIADANMDGKLDNDVVISVSNKVLKSQSTKNLKDLPEVNISNIPGFYNYNRYFFSRVLILQPDTIRTGKMGLNLISTEYRRGTFHFNGRKFEVFARQPEGGLRVTEPKLAQIHISKISEVHNAMVEKKSIVHLNDTAWVDNYSFVIRQADPLLDSIKIFATRHKKFAH